MAFFGRIVQGSRARQIPRIDRRATRKQELHHLQMAVPRRVAKGPRAKPIASIHRGATIEQLCRQTGTILVRRRKQRERHLDGAYLGFLHSKPISNLVASLGIGGASYCRRTKNRNRARAQN
jgi:hypothetical protein